MHSNEKSAPPPVRSTIACTTLSRPTSSGLTKCVMPNFLAISPSRGIEVDADDLVGADHAGALDHVEADAAEAEHHDIGAGPDLGGVDHRADAGRDAAADVADLVEGRVLAHLGERDLGQHGEVREGRAAHVVEHLAAVAGEAAGAVRHHALALGGADRGAEVGALRQAGFALAAFGRVERDDVVADLDRGHAGADLAHDARRPRGRGWPGTCPRNRGPTACRRRCGRRRSP